MTANSSRRRPGQSPFLSVPAVSASVLKIVPLLLAFVVLWPATPASAAAFPAKEESPAKGEVRAIGSLKLNVDASGQDTAGVKNHARVELLDANEKALAGYSKDDCDPIHENSVNRTVTWKGQEDVSELAGRVVRLKIFLKGAELYAFQFMIE
ncbi:MAG: hypothetical protein IT426_06670 [Pirellulales bacterium]|nr:hypothetical protein [Pirellulales bacterium]